MEKEKKVLKIVEVPLFQEFSEENSFSKIEIIVTKVEELDIKNVTKVVLYNKKGESLVISTEYFQRFFAVLNLAEIIYSNNESSKNLENLLLEVLN